MTAASAAPLALASTSSANAPTAVADNPYQLTYDVANRTGCDALNLPPEQDFVLESVAVSEAVSNHVTLYGAIKAGGVHRSFGDFFIPINANTQSGQQAFNVVVRPAVSLAAAAEGDLYWLGFCTSFSTAFGPEAAIILTGQRIGSPTAARVLDFQAHSGKAGATMHWTTASETEIAGFNIWRYRGAKGVKVNRTLIRAKRSGEPAGASYRYLDNVRGSKRGLTYRLQLVDLNGKRTWYAAFAIASK